MRITGGDAKGRSLRVKKSLLTKGLRPTSHKVRKALFDILQDRIIGAKFLDLFAGTGAVGIEAISRGAQKAVLVEANKGLIKNLEKNINHLEMKEKITVVYDDVLRYLLRTDEVFDIVFADPPYSYENYKELVELLIRGSILAEGGMVIVEHSSKVDMRHQTEGILNPIRLYRYGDTSLSIFIKNTLE